MTAHRKQVLFENCQTIQCGDVQDVNDRLDTLGRATVLSALAMASSPTVIPVQLGTGLLSDVSSPLTALAVVGGVLVVGSLLVLGRVSPVESSTGYPAEAE